MRPGTNDILETATRCGFSRAVLLPAEKLPYTPNAHAERSGIVGDPFALMEGARSVLVMGMPFQWYAQWPAGRSEVSAYYLKSQQAHLATRKLAALLRDSGLQVFDGQRLPLKLYGRQAGFGVIGRNSLLRNNVWGSCFVLQALITDAPPPDAQPSPIPAPTHGCGACRRCVRACPTGALDGTGRLDLRLCIRAHMLSGEPVPADLRDAMGKRLLGCEACQRVCPQNAGIPLRPPPDSGFDIADLLAANQETVAAIALLLGKNEARRQRLQAQACLVAGNSGQAVYLPPLEALTQSERPAISAHARWAIKKIKEGESHHVET